MEKPQFSHQVSAFRALHESGCFVIPNPWDAGSARILQSQGFKALASSSAGFAFSKGLPDAMSVLSVTDVLAHLRELVNATSLPVNADFQAGYSADLDGLAMNVTRCVLTGVAGLSIEDATGDPTSPLFERQEALARLRTARRVIDESGTGVLLTARCEACLVGVPDWERIVLDRVVAFANAGADCIFAPGLRDSKSIAQVVQAVAPKPVNVIVSSPDPGLTVRALADLGVRRISVGSALARVAYGAFVSASEQIASSGDFSSLGSAASFKQMNEYFLRRK